MSDTPSMKRELPMVKADVTWGLQPEQGSSGPLMLSFTIVNLAKAPSQDELLEQLSKEGVELRETSTRHFEMKGKSPRMTEAQLIRAWLRLVRRNNWSTEYHG